MLIKLFVVCELFVLIKKYLINYILFLQLQIAYWDVAEAVDLRMMDGSLEGEVNSLSITK